MEQELSRHLTALCHDIGVRLTGTPGERAAGDYIAEEFRRAGAMVSREPFPVNVREVHHEQVEILLEGKWVTFPCSLFGNTPGTEGRTLEAPLVFFESPAETSPRDLSRLRGKAVLHLGSHIESRQAYRELMEAQPAFLLFVDVRFPGDVPLADSMFPAYTEALGAVPTVGVAYMSAWEWARLGASAARLTVGGGMRPGQSENIVAELPGQDPDGDILFLGAHHDTQADSVGADDNGSGVAGLLALATVLAPQPRRRTIRLISFGAEEQLSVGSCAYVRAHREELRARGRLMFNLDAFGSLMGWTEIISNGPPELVGLVRSAFARHGLPVRMLDGMVPYADHFPFVAADVPSLWMWRPNCPSGRFFHHRPDDDLSRLSIPMMSRLLAALAEFEGEMANVPDLPFGRTIPANQADSVKQYWNDLFGGWKQS